MSLLTIAASSPVPQADARLVDRASLEQSLRSSVEGEIRFDAVSRALYATDASVYQIAPIGVVIPRTEKDLLDAVRICRDHRCPITMRGGGTSQAGQAIGSGLVIDTSKYLNAILELNVEERWVRVQPGIVLDELNAHLRAHGLRFAPDISTASRATIGGMIANNSAGARSVLYGKTIDHVLDLRVVLADGQQLQLGELTPAELEELCQSGGSQGRLHAAVRDIARGCADEVAQRYPKVLRRVMGYNLDEFTHRDKPFNLARLIVGSEGTLAVVLEARLKLVPLPKAKAVLVIEFEELLEALGATPLILRHKPSAVEVMDRFILDNTRQSPALDRMRRAILQGEPGALLCVEFYGDRESDLLPRLAELEADLQQSGYGARFHRATTAAEQARIWGLREAALGLSMAMKEDAKSLSFVEDTAVAPEYLREYIKEFLTIVARHRSVAGVYAHASVGCLHVRPVVNMKTEEGVRKFEAIANDVADLVLRFGGALSGEHGDGLVRSPFIAKMFGPVIYDAFRRIKLAFDPAGILNPGKIVDSPPITSNLRFGPGYRTPDPPVFFDYSEYGGMGGAVEMCSGLGACRKKLDGVMCPSYMATLEEAHSTRGRANVLRLAMANRLSGLSIDDEGVYSVLDLCLECRACKAECPVGVDMARFKSEFLASYRARHGLDLTARVLGNTRALAEGGSRFSSFANLVASSRPVRVLNEWILGIDRRRIPPRWASRTLVRWAAREGRIEGEVLIFNDTFTNFYDPEIGIAAIEVLEAAGVRAGVAENDCCGRPLISKGMLPEARAQAEENTKRLYRLAVSGKKFLFCEPGCLSAVKEDAPSLLRGETRRQAQVVASASLLFEEYLENELAEQRASIQLKPLPEGILFHGHCHQKAMGLLPATKLLLSRIPQAGISDPDAGCCGMAGSFGYTKDHYDVSRRIAERKLLPAIRHRQNNARVVATGTSCRHQIAGFTGLEALHPAVLLRSLLADRG